MSDFKNYSNKSNMNNINRFLVFILLLFSYVTVQSQSSEYIYGRLVDSNNGNGIPFATILVKELEKGVISNAQGGFSIPKIIQNQNDTLIISCIGYKSRFVNFKSLNNQELNTIKLDIAITELDEVVIKANKKIKSQSPYKIVKRAIEQIPTNYPNTPFSYIAYYRDYQMKSDTYINLNEALIENLDYGFHTCDQKYSKIRLLEYKVDSSFERDSNLEINYDNLDRKFIPDAHIHPYGGNELTMLMIHDAIRNYEYSTYSFMYIMKEDFLRNHRFDQTKVIEIEGGSLFVIDFKSRKTINDIRYQAIGQIFINRDTYAIHKLLYSIYRTQEEEKPLIFNVNIEYAKKQDLMYLNYLSFNNVFKIPNPKDFATKEIVYNMKSRSISVKFNNPYSPIGILSRSNYKVKIDNKKVRINKIVQDSTNNKKVYIELDNITDFPEIQENDSTRLQVDFKNLTDIDGRKLNHRTYLTYNQYRELFVQQVHTNGKEKSMHYVNKFLPLKDNSISEYMDSIEYWMNTPAKR